MAKRRYLLVGLFVALVAVVPGIAAAAESPDPSVKPTAAVSATPAPTQTSTAPPIVPVDPTPRVCAGLFPDTVEVGDSFDFGGPLSQTEPEPFMVFRSDDGREITHLGHRDAFEFYDLTISIADSIWIGVWTVELHTGVAGDPPCQDRFTVAEWATGRPATPRLTLPASSSDIPRGEGSGTLATVLVLLVASTIAAAALAAPRRPTRR